MPVEFVDDNHSAIRSTEPPPAAALDCPEEFAELKSILERLGLRVNVRPITRTAVEERGPDTSPSPVTSELQTLANVLNDPNKSSASVTLVLLALIFFVEHPNINLLSGNKFFINWPAPKEQVVSRDTRGEAGHSGIPSQTEKKQPPPGQNADDADTRADQPAKSEGVVTKPTEAETKPKLFIVEFPGIVCAGYSADMSELTCRFLAQGVGQNIGRTAQLAENTAANTNKPPARDKAFRTQKQRAHQVASTAQTAKAVACTLEGAPCPVIDEPLPEQQWKGPAITLQWLTENPFWQPSDPLAFHHRF